MTLTERCQAAEAKLEDISTALLDDRREILDQCETELLEVAGLLEGESFDSSARPAAADRAGLLRLKQRARLLGLQVQYAVNLCQGWTQLHLSEGYTDQGTPVLPPNTPQTSYEG